MIFFLVALALGIYYLEKRKEGINRLDVLFLVFFLIGIEMYLLQIESDVAKFYWASGTAGSGLTYAQCSEVDEYGNCLGYIYHVYASGYDENVGIMIAVRQAEAAILKTLAPAVGIVLLLVLWGLVNEVGQKIYKRVV